MKTKSELIKSALHALEPIKKISVSDWADAYRYLPTTASEPGRWKTSRVPYMKAVMDAFSDIHVQRVVVMSAAQVGKTETLLCILARYIHVDPCNMMLVNPTLEMSQDFSKDRLEKMIHDSNVLAPLFFGSRENAKSRDKNQTILSKFFKGGRLVLCGANSPAGLASRPIRILLCDEVDRFPASAAAEGDPVNLAAKRTSNYWNKKIGLFSTPTTEGASRIELEYRAGTREEWNYRCPNCGEFHTLDHRRMVTDFDELSDESGNKTVIVNSVNFRCPDCGMEFSENEMKASEQKYIALNPKAIDNGIRSFWINGFSSPWVSWKDIMQEWYEARGNPKAEQVVYNTRFGLSYRMRGDFDDESEFLRNREEYPGELPDSVMLLTCAVDVQHTRLEYEVAGWAPQGRYGILRGVVLGSPTDYSTWLLLDEVLEREYHFSDGRALKITRTFVDSGYVARFVYEYCAMRRLKGVFPIKGMGAAGIPLLYRYTQPKGAGVLLVSLGVNEGKAEVLSNLTKKTYECGAYHFPRDDIHFTRGYDQVYFKQLLSEQQVIKKSGGMSYISWEKVDGKARNESLDLAVYNLACFKSLVGAADESVFWANRKAELSIPSKNETSPSKPTQKSRTAKTKINLF